MENIHPFKITHDQTNTLDHSERQFRIKQWNKELPVKEKLHYRSPKLYTDANCLKCGRVETTTHPFTCPIQIETTRNQIIQIYNEEISARYNHKQSITIFNELTQVVHSWSDTTLTAISSGIIIKDIIKIVTKYVDQNQIDTCIHNSQNRFYQYLRIT